MKVGMEHLTTLVKALVISQLNPHMKEEKMTRVVLTKKGARGEHLPKDGGSVSGVKVYDNDLPKSEMQVSNDIPGVRQRKKTRRRYNYYHYHSGEATYL